MDKRFSDGIYFREKPSKAPDFVLGAISINRDKLIDWLQGEETDDQGYVRLDVLRSKKGQPYITVSTYKPKSKDDEIEVDNIF